MADFTALVYGMLLGSGDLVGGGIILEGDLLERQSASRRENRSAAGSPRSTYDVVRHFGYRGVVKRVSV